MIECHQIEQQECVGNKDLPHVEGCVSSDKTHDEHMKVTAGIVRKITLIAEGFWVHKGLKEHPLWWEVAGRKTCQFQEPLWLPCSEF